MTASPEVPPAPAGDLAIHVTRQWGDFRLSASLNLPAAGVSALFGRSGSGKTSLLRLIAGLDAPDRGSIRFGDTTLADTATGIHVPPQRRGLGVVFQDGRLFPHYRVRGNLRYGQRSDDAVFNRIIEQLGIQSLLERYPATLSGGEARRVAIARALLTEPRLLLLDEPLTGLDSAHQRELLGHVRKLASTIAIPVIHISHDAREIATVADHIAVLDQGHVVANGPLADILARVELTPYLGGFEAVSLITGTLADHDPAYALSELRLPDGQRLVIPAVDRQLGDPVRIQVPVRDVAVAVADPQGTSYRNRLRARIEQAHPSAEAPGVMELRLRLADQPLRARLTRRSYDELGLGIGDEVIALVRTVAFDRP